MSRKSKKGKLTMQKSKIVLAVNTCITNDPCALCGARCDPCGLDYTLKSKKRGRVLVCDRCATKHAPELVEAREVALRYAQWEREQVAENRPPPAAVQDNAKLRELAKHLLAAVRVLKPDVANPQDSDLPF